PSKCKSQSSSGRRGFVGPSRAGDKLDLSTLEGTVRNYIEAGIASSTKKSYNTAQW
uniref:Uncharacterized protein n=1 Tax=Amphimedon queenslandica TaxID=400682 RepID=A0A1X7V6A9_AMPQE